MNLGSQPLEEVSAVLRCFGDEVQAILGGESISSQNPDPATLTQPQRRVLIRTIFASTEALAFLMKQAALVGPSANALADSERMICREVSHDLKDNGEPLERSMRLRFAPNMLFSFATFAKGHGVQFKMDTNLPGWQHLIQGS